MFARIIPPPPWVVPPTPVRSEVTIWGTVPLSQIRPMLDGFETEHRLNYTLNYKEVSEESLRRDLIEAIAKEVTVKGSAPDLVFFPHERLLSISDTLGLINKDLFSSREFRDTFVEAGEIFIGQGGIYAVPMVIDPLVLYWNRDILSSKGKTSPPATWTDVYEMSVAITEKDSTGNIGKGLLTIAMGEAQNINWFKDILSLIFLEAGEKLVTVDRNNNLTPSLGVTGVAGSAVSSNAGQTILFYTNFAKITSPYYTWTGAMPSSIDAFIAEKLALYLGRASDYNKIVGKNPHLNNFDVAQVPQFDNKPLTYGSVFGMGVVRQGKDPMVAWKVLELLKDKKYNNLLARGMFLAPARKDLLRETQNNPFGETFYRSAEISANWLDPDPEKTKEIFQFLVTDVASGRSSPSKAVADASFLLWDALEKINTRNQNAKTR